MRTALCLGLCLALAQAATVEAAPVRGRLQLQDVYAFESKDSLAALAGARTRNNGLGDLRLEWAPHDGNWSFDAAYVIAFAAGDAPGYTPSGVFPAAPPATWWNLTNTFINQPHLVATQRIDRLSVSYTSVHVVLRAGRQALTWGAGQIFRPMDLFDPFAPDATDTEYKPGADMVYGQYLFDDGSDLQAVIVPRPAHKGGALTWDASSFALHYHRAIGDYQTTWMIARDHGDVVAGIGINGSLGEATWNVELVPTFVQGGGTYTSALVNISDAGTLADRDITYFAEYFRNGFGEAAQHYTLAALPTPLVDRLLRGQVFDTGRDYLGLGAQYQWTPLLTISPTLIANLDDRSLYLLSEATYSLSDNLNLIVGAQLPVGPAHTEFGGLGVLTSAPPYLEPPTRFYVQLRRYF